MTDLKQMTEQAVDLGDVAEQKALRDKENEQRAEAAALEQVGRWDRRMNRAFQGIVAGHVRRSMLRRAGERAEDE